MTLAQLTKCNADPANADSAPLPSHEEVFMRNRELITEEQQKLRNSRVAFAGTDSAGGGHPITLARLGIGKLTKADLDVFQVANINRQSGATISNLGRNQAEAMAESRSICR